MKITFEQFEDYLTEFLEINEESLAWEAKIPQDLNDYFDNTYTNALGNKLDLTMALLFGDDWDDVCWFIYECMGSEDIRNIKNNVVVDDRVYSIKDLASYLDYAKKELKFGE